MTSVRRRARLSHWAAVSGACASGTPYPRPPRLRRPGAAGIAMASPGAPARSQLLPAASGPRRKRAAGDAGAATGRQRVLDEEEYIEVAFGADARDFRAPRSPPRPPRRVPTLRAPPHPEAVGSLSLRPRRVDRQGAELAECGASCLLCRGPAGVGVCTRRGAGETGLCQGVSRGLDSGGGAFLGSGGGGT